MKAILTDITRCIGCESCVAACKAANDLPPDRPYDWQRTDGLNANRWTTVLRHEGRFVRKQCRHCIDPACVSVCPVAALERQNDGAVIYHAEICMGCRYCIMACPFGIPRYEWDSPMPTVRKCILCYERMDAGAEEPACTASCPVGATVFGEREELLAEAHRRIEAEPERYLPKVKGEREAGGTAVMYIGDVELDSVLGWDKVVHEEPLPKLTWSILRGVPFEFIGMGLAMGGLWWIIERRERRERERAAARGGEDES